MATVREVTESNLQAIRVFLEAHIETSLFLLSNLITLGWRLGENLNSGNYRLIEEGGEIVAVFCLIRRGNILAQTGGRLDFSDKILDACKKERIPIKGVVAEWQIAEALWHRLCSEKGFQPIHTSKEILCRLALTDPTAPAEIGDNARHLVESDVSQWEVLNRALSEELSLPVQGTSEQLRANFKRYVDAKYWWGAFEGDKLISTACLNAAYGDMGQVGGVYTLPEKRRRGFLRAVMNRLIADARDIHGHRKLILFTGEVNVAAKKLYESLGFKPFGHFGLLFGSGVAGVLTPLRSGKCNTGQSDGKDAARSFPAS